MYGNVQETKNLMSHYESDGDYILIIKCHVINQELHYAD